MADRMAEMLDAEVTEPEAIDPDPVHEYDLVGCGSGICLMKAHPRLWRLVWRLPCFDGIPAFWFFASGADEVPLVGYSQLFRYPFALMGLRVHDSFCCRGLDTYGPIRLVGGVNKERPNDRDLDRAAAFVMRLRERVARPEPAA